MELGPGYTTEGTPMPDLTSNLPPPTYNEVLGTYKSSLDDPNLRSGLNTCSIAYIDIMPKCLDLGNKDLKRTPQFEVFSNLLVTANLWLEKNPHVRALKCETIERKVDFLPKDLGSGIKYDFDTMFRHEPQNGIMIIAKGLRLWLTENKNQGFPPQQLSSFDVMPDRQTVKVPTVDATDNFFKVGEKLLAYGDRRSVRGNFETFAGLKETVAKLNGIFKAEPLPGTILNLELVPFRRNAEQTDIEFDSRASCHSVDQSKLRRVTYVIRVFYVSGPASHEEIGFHCAGPALKKLPEAMRGPVFHEQFDTSIATAQTLSQLQGRRIVNIQQFDARYFWKNENVYVAYDSMDQVEWQYTQRDFIKTQITFFSSSNAIPAPPPPTFLTYKFFLPHRTGLKSYENMAQTTHRVICWLRATGLQFVAVDSFEMPFTGSHLEGVNIDKSTYCLAMQSGHYWVQVIRLFFSNGYQEPHPSLLPQALDWRSQNDVSSRLCGIL